MAGDNLKLQVLFSAIDKLTGPLDRMRNRSRDLGTALRDTKKEVRSLADAQNLLGKFKLQDAALAKRTAELEAARAATAKFKAELAATDAPTIKMAKAVERAEKQEARLTQQHEKQSAALAELRGKLDAAGVETTDLAAAESKLASKMDAANAKMEQQQAQLAKLGRARANAEKWQARGAGMAMTGAAMSATITAPMILFGKSAIQAAIDAEELTSAFNVTFKASGAVMSKWADDTAAAMGRSRVEIMQAANTFGIFFNQAAAPEKAAALSREFSVLAQDLASFYNTDIATAIGKLRSGLSGESEPLRDFGVFLTEANVKAKALAMGLKPVNGELTEQQKILARGAIIMEQTKNAQGDVARTSQSDANRLRAANAQWENMKVMIGSELIPVLIPFIGTLTKLLSRFNSLSPGTQKFVISAGLVLAVLGPLLGILGGLVTVVAGVAAAFSIAFAPALAIVLGVVAVLGLLAYGAYKLYQSWDPAKGFFENIWARINAIFGTTIGQILRIAMPIINLPIFIINNWGKITQFFRAVFDGLVAMFKWAGQNMMSSLLAALNPAAFVRHLIGMADAGIKAFKNAMGIKSPSRVMMEMGGHITRGLSIGLDRGGAGALKSMGRIATGLAGAAAIGTAAPAFAGGAGAASRAGAMPSAVTYNVTIQIQGADAGDPRAAAQAIKRELDHLLAIEARGGYADV